MRIARRPKLRQRISAVSNVCIKSLIVAHLRIPSSRSFEMLQCTHVFTELKRKGDFH